MHFDRTAPRAARRPRLLLNIAMLVPYTQNLCNSLGQRTQLPANSGGIGIQLWRAPKVAAFAHNGRAPTLGAMLMTDETPFADLIGHNIRLARKDADLSQLDLAHRIGVDRRHVSRWERGERRPTEASLERLADALRVPKLWFYGEHDA